MKFSVDKWKAEIISFKGRKAMPIMSYPGLSLINRDIIDMVTNGEVQYKCIRELAKRYNTIACSTMIMELSIEAEIFGCKIRYTKDEIPTVVEGVVKSLDDVDKLEEPMIGDGRTKEYLKAARLLIENVDDRPVLGGIIGPFSLASRLYEISNLMMDILINPDASAKLLKKCTDFLIKYSKAFKEAGANGIIIAEPAAGLLSSDLCDEFSSKYVRRIVEAVKDSNFMVILHNCGHTTGLVTSMLKTGCDAIHVGNAVNIIDILKQVSDDILVFGNLDPVGIFKNANIDIIHTATLELLDATIDYRNFVISSGCDIPPNTPIENIDAFFKAIESFNNKKYL